jgi:hypothetical protein
LSPSPIGRQASGAAAAVCLCHCERGVAYILGLGMPMLAPRAALRGLVRLGRRHLALAAFAGQCTERFVTGLAAKDLPPTIHASAAKPPPTTPHKLATLSRYRQPSSSIGRFTIPQCAAAFFRGLSVDQRDKSKVDSSAANNGSIIFLPKIYDESGPCLIRAKSKASGPTTAAAAPLICWRFLAAGPSLPSVR